MKLGFFIVLAATGCASAGKGDEIGGRPDGGGIHLLDSDNSEPRPDADLTDAPPLIDAAAGQQTMTLTQTNDQTMTSNNSLACGTAPPDIGTTENTYYRVYDLASLHITTDFTVQSITFQVEDCESNSTTDCAPVAVRVGTYAGTVGETLQKNKITYLASNNNVQVPTVVETASGSPGATVTAPISATIPGSSKMIIALDAPDGTNTYQFYIGSNTGGQTGIGYISSPNCPNPGTTPTDIGNVPSPPADIDILLSVTGSY